MINIPTPCKTGQGYGPAFGDKHRPVKRWSKKGYSTMSEFGFETVWDQYIDNRIVCLAGRYIWRGLATREVGPFVVMYDSKQVINHDATSIKEEIDVGDGVSINGSACEAIYLEKNVKWIKE